MLTDIDIALTAELCDAALAQTAGERQITADPLDGSVRIDAIPAAVLTEITRGLDEGGLATSQTAASRLHVTDWDPRLLRRRLGVLLAGVDDLKIEWAATAELAMYYFDARAAEGECAFLEHVETALTTSIPFPRRIPSINDQERLVELVTAAEDAYTQLIEEHIEFADRILSDYAELITTVGPEQARTAILNDAANR